MVRRTFLIVISMILIPVILVGCQSKDDVKVSNTEITKVSISDSEGFANINTDFFAVYKDEETLETFKNVFANAIKKPGVVDIIEPEFDLEVIYKDGNKQGYHLWLGEKDGRSTLMKLEDTHTIYSISEETNQLIDLIK